MTPNAPVRRIVHVRIAKVPPATPDEADADVDGPACGWFDSSFALRQGLAVQELGPSELPDADGTLAALWFAALAKPAAAGSACRQ